MTSPLRDATEILADSRFAHEVDPVTLRKVRNRLLDEPCPSWCTSSHEHRHVTRDDRTMTPLRLFGWFVFAIAMWVGIGWTVGMFA